MDTTLQIVKATALIGVLAASFVCLVLALLIIARREQLKSFDRDIGDGSKDRRPTRSPAASGETPASGRTPGASSLKSTGPIAARLGNGALFAKGTTRP
ncbi:MAG: hypothetical protein JJ902_22675 [Roseibium sp.]|nr:hypothetical protein [Roseibium sp.]